MPSSLNTGTVGVIGERAAPVAASMRKRPDLTCGNMECTLANIS
jgi:hypothetical protein